MKPVSPVVPGHSEVVYAKDQPEYLPLPAHRTEDGCVTTRWKLTWQERLRVLFMGNIYLQLLTFNTPLQPVMLSTTVPEELRLEKPPTELGLDSILQRRPNGGRE